MKNFLKLEQKIQARGLIVLFIISAIVLPIILKNTNTLCQVLGVVLPIICGALVIVAFYSNYGYGPWSWQSEKQKQ